MFGMNEKDDMLSSHDSTSVTDGAPFVLPHPPSNSGVEELTRRLVSLSRPPEPTSSRIP
jgi:hypothetical protein